MAFVLALAAMLAGVLVTYLYDDDQSCAARLCTGAAIGFAMLGLIGFVFASLFGLTPLTVALSGATTVAAPIAALILLTRRQQHSRAQPLVDVAAAIRAAICNMPGLVRLPVRLKRQALAYLAYYTLILLLLSVLFNTAMYTRADGIYTDGHNKSDLPLHIGIITGFVHGENFPPEHPELAGARLTYPFLADFIAAMFMQAGLKSIRTALLLENLVLALALVGVLHRWALKLTGDRVAALVAPLLIFFSGGLGWVVFLRDWLNGESSIFEMLGNLPHDYTIYINNLVWSNTLTTLLLTQRSLLLGLPLFLIVWTLWWQACGEAASAVPQHNHQQRGPEAVEAAAMRRMIAAGAIAGLLPLAHAHSFVVLIGMGAWLALLFRRCRLWAVFFAVALLLALPQIWWVTRGSSMKAESFIGWHLGWDNTEDNFIKFWFKNLGLFIPLLLTAVAWRGRKPVVPHRLLLFSLPFILCFIIPNMLKLAPRIWDNYKVLFYWYVAAAPLVALLLARLWRGTLAYRTASALLFITLTFAGSLSVWRVVTRAGESKVFDIGGIEFANLIGSNTRSQALILHAPIYNHPVLLSGRRSLLGDPWHLWSHGLGYADREAALKRIYVGAPDADALLAEYKVEYVVIGSLEREVLERESVFVNERYFERYPKTVEAGGYRLYKIIPVVQP